MASVDSDGLVTAHKAGKATITAATDNGVKAKLKLEVKSAAEDRKHYVIAHAMGGVDGYDYTNSLEAFNANYARGHRFFEVDFRLTSDGKMVLWHNWDMPFCSDYDAGYKPTYKQFMKSRIFDRFTPLDLKKLLKLMDDYPDITVIPDTKYADVTTAKKQYKDIVSTAKKLGVSKVLDRTVVSIYNEEMFKPVDKIHHFNAYMASLNRSFKVAPTLSQLKSVAKFCKKKGIKTVAMYAEWWQPEYADILDEYGLEAALFTVNRESAAQRFYDEGVTVLFSDTLPPV